MERRLPEGRCCRSRCAAGARSSIEIDGPATRTVGNAAGAWRGGEWVRERFVDVSARRARDRPAVRNSLPRRSHRAIASLAGLDPAASRPPRVGTGRGRHSPLDQAGVAAHQKNAHYLSAWLVFIDESGLLLLPVVRRTWGPRG